jgi:hypothetical protein
MQESATANIRSGCVCVTAWQVYWRDPIRSPIPITG